MPTIFTKYYVNGDILLRHKSRQNIFQLKLLGRSVLMIGENVLSLPLFVEKAREWFYLVKKARLVDGNRILMNNRMDSHYTVDRSFKISVMRKALNSFYFFVKK